MEREDEDIAPDVIAPFFPLVCVNVGTCVVCRHVVQSLTGKMLTNLRHFRKSTIQNHPEQLFVAS